MFKKLVILLLALFLVACSSGNKVTYTLKENDRKLTVELYYKDDNTVTKVHMIGVSTYSEKSYENMNGFVTKVNNEAEGFKARATKKNDKLEIDLVIDLEKASDEKLMQLDARLFKNGKNMKLEDAQTFFQDEGYTKE